MGHARPGAAEEPEKKKKKKKKKKVRFWGWGLIHAQGRGRPGARIADGFLPRLPAQEKGV